MKKALITGITGQDGSYLAELLLEKGYQVSGLVRRSSTFNTQRIDHLIEHQDASRFKWSRGDLADSESLLRTLREHEPDEVYHLAAQSHVQVSFETPEYTANADALGTLRLLEAIRILKLEKKTRFYQASTSELYGNAEVSPQNEQTPFHPQSPYAVAKLYAYWITENYRNGYGIHASNGILFNHEGPTRGETFVTRKITRAVAAIEMGREDCVYLGNLNAERDWGHAKDYADGMWKILQQPKSDDYVLATGESRSVRQFVEFAFAEIDRKVEWRGEGIQEEGVDANTGAVLVKVDERYFRPTEVNALCGDASKAERVLGWKPKISFSEMVREMVQADLKELKQASE